MAALPEPLGFSRMQPSVPRASILLVDDNPANLLALRAILDDLGQNLVEARSGEEALQCVQLDEFAVVLLDVLMPGIGGFETAKAIRAADRSRHTPIIFLTASDIDRSQMEQGYALGAVDFLVKPLLPIILQAKVRGFVELFQDKQRAQARSRAASAAGARNHGIRHLHARPAGPCRSPGIPGRNASRGTRPRRSSASTSPASTRQDAVESGWPATRAEGRPHRRPLRGRGLAAPQGRHAVLGQRRHHGACATRAGPCGGSRRSPGT